MFFNYIAGIQEVDKEKVKINHRDAVRAVILRGNDILMVHNNKGDYKFPGGGAYNGENHNETLKREVREETGYIVSDVKDKIGVFTERKLDDKDENSIFEMTSYYYECEVSKDKTIQQLDDYEEQLDFKPVWISLDEAIRLNEEILKNKTDINSWVYRETSALIAIREYHCNDAMFIPFSREEGVLDQKPFLDYEVQFNLFYRIIEGREVIALRTEDKNAIALQNPGFPMWLWINETLEESKIKNIINDLCNKLKEDELHAISGKPEFVKYFADQYSKVLGVSYELGLGMEAYECPKIIKPKGVQGKLIKAELKHTDVVADFCAGFGYWCFGVTVTKESQIPSAKEMIESGNLFLWEVNGEICSMANIAHRSKRHARLNNVYTPPKQRKKGYASAIVAELCSKVNDEGLIPMLYADVKNPDSNKVYKGVGFEEHGRIARFDFKYK